MKIYTRTGDSGMTSLAQGQRVSKSDLRVCVYGTIDELNSILGIVIAAGKMKRKSINYCWISKMTFLQSETIWPAANNH